MKRLKRFAAVVLALVMVFTMLPQDAFAATVASGTCGENLTWTLDNAGVLIISGDGAMDNWAYCDAPWDRYHTSIKSVIFEEGVTSIGNNAFYYHINLTSVTFSNSLTSIGEYAFSLCSNLTYICISSGITSISEYAFRYCSNLSKIQVAEDNPVFSSDSFGVLYNKDKSTLIKVPDALSGSYIIPDSVTNIDDFAFENCNSLKYNTYYDANYCGNIDNPYFALVSTLNKDIDNCNIHWETRIICDHAFYGCSNISVIIIPYNVTSVGSMAFYNCDGAVSLVVGERVNNISYCAFGECRNLKSVSLGNSLETIGVGAFGYCEKLTDIIFSDSVTTIEDEAFRYCYSLSTVSIPDGVSHIGSLAFSGCDNLSGIFVSENNLAYASDSAGVLYNKNKTTLIQAPCKLAGDYTIIDSVIGISDFAFVGCVKMTSVTIPDSVTSIGNNAFSGCGKLTDVYYSGTAKQWTEIEIERRNECLTNATLHTVAPVLTVVEIAAMLSKTEYWVGEELDITGLKLKVVYHDGSTEEITEGFTISGFDSTTAGTKTVTVTYEGFTATFEVIVAICEHQDVENGRCVDCGEVIGSVLTDNAGNKQLFTTFAEALAVAEAGRTLALTDNAEISNLLLPSGVTLDLNGYALVVDSIVTYSSNAIIDTSTDVGGLLKLNDFDGNMISPDNSSLPVYDKAAGGYRFFEIDVESCAVTGKKNGSSKYWFKVNPKNFVRFNELIQAGSKVQIKVKMTWAGQSTLVYASANLEFTKDWANNYNTNEDIYITVAVAEAQDYENFTLTPVIAANSVEISGEEM